MKKWDEKYAAQPDGLFGSAPGQYVREISARSDFEPATALFLADGDGRNSRWLASRGVQVTALDVSPVATRNGVALDGNAGIFVERVVADLETWTPPAGRLWDAVFQLYLHGPSSVRLTALRTGWQALAVGGWLVVEGFSKAQAGSDVGPGKPQLMYDLEEIEACVTGAVIVEALSGRVRLDEGSRHQGLVETVRFAARKV